MNLPPLTGFEWAKLQRRDPGRVNREGEGEKEDFHKDLRNRRQTGRFWQELRDHQGDWLKETGLLPQVERWARNPEGQPHRDPFKDPRGVPYAFHHRKPGSLCGTWENEQINHVANLIVIPARAHNAFDNALYNPVANILKPSETVWAPIVGQVEEAGSFYGRVEGEIRSLEEDLHPLAVEKVKRNPKSRTDSPEAIREKAREMAVRDAGNLVSKAMQARELPEVAKKNPANRDLAQEARNARDGFKKLMAKTGKQFEEWTGEPWQHLLPGREGLLERAGAALRGVFGRGAAIESGIAAFQEGKETIGELRNGKFAEAGRDGLKAAGSAAYALTPAMAFFRTPAMMALKRLPVIGAVAGFAEAGYDGYRALGSRLAGKKEDAGFWASQALWRGAGAAGNLALSGMGPPGWVGALGVSWLAERQAANIEDSRRIRGMDKDQLRELYRNGGISSRGEGGRRQERGEELSLGKDQEMGKAPEPVVRGFFGQAPGRWVPPLEQAVPKEEEARSVSAHGARPTASHESPALAAISHHCEVSGERGVDEAFPSVFDRGMSLSRRDRGRETVPFV
ncbi:MAG: hypothetical protein PHO89_10800, partial [Methylacidiphilaceae bacterium]|nr:hypothetical protein [Candidatus Methylacidiphilaceae bacterium]